MSALRERSLGVNPRRPSSFSSRLILHSDSRLSLLPVNLGRSSSLLAAARMMSHWTRRTSKIVEHLIDRPGVASLCAGTWARGPQLEESGLHQCPDHDSITSSRYG